MKLGKEIAQMRKDHSMTQEAFGQLFHVTRQTVSNWENEKSYPDLQTLVDISEHFGVSLDRLLKEDSTMIQTIDKERRTGKRLAKGLIAAVGTIAILCAAYCGFWYSQKSSFEKQFDATMEKYGFSEEVLTDENGERFATGNVVAKDGDIRYIVQPTDFPALLSFKTSIDESAAFIVAECGNDDEKQLVLRYSSADAQTAPSATTLYLDQGLQENADGTFTPILSAEYTLDENSLPYAGHLDDDTRAAYDSMKDDVQTAVGTMQKMFKDFYA
ncbi:MAG: helix-turn-helix transcriptional regulator [Peptococcaceae bacterium]|nr:helix-turn-helix transcriptional regulator [Peptococcaceae bacterium]